MRQSGLADAVELRYQDYRDLPAHAGQPFDAIVSIEMFEAVGREYWRGYFQTLRDCLKPGAWPAYRPSRCAKTCSRAICAPPTSSSSTSSRAGCCPASAFEQEARRAGLVVERIWPSAATMRKRCAAGASPSSTNSTPCAPGL
jgi:cyclopropane-fatty-acyl-phospholipid synthase